MQRMPLWAMGFITRGPLMVMSEQMAFNMPPIAAGKRAPAPEDEAHYSSDMAIREVSEWNTITRMLNR